MLASRRSILPGLVLLAALPGAGQAAPAVSPVEAACDRITLARLQQLTGGDPGPSVVAVLRALNDLKALDRPEEEFYQAGREAFRAARRIAATRREAISRGEAWVVPARLPARRPLQAA